jgi:Leucine Rich repeat
MAEKPRRLQFGIRTFLIGVAVVSVLLAVANAILVPWYIDRGKFAMLKEVDAQVFTEPRGQFLLRQFVGDTFSERSIYLHLNDPRIDDGWLKDVGGMQHIEVLSIKSSKLTDTGLMELRNWPNLQSLNLVDTKVTNSGIAALRQSLPNLRLIKMRQTEP